MESINKKEVGINIRRIMDEKGISVKDIRDHLELESEQSIYAWMNGRNLPTTDKLYALSQLFGVSMDEIMCGRKKKNFTDVVYFETDLPRYEKRLKKCEKGIRMLLYYFKLDKLEREKKHEKKSN